MAKTEAGLGGEALAKREETADVSFLYTNHKGETRLRRVRTLGVRHGTSAWHEVPGFLLAALDLESGKVREFSFAGMAPAPEAAR